MTLIDFPKAKRSRRETKAGIAESIFPKVFGILGNGEITIHGGLFHKYSKQAIIRRELAGLSFGASFCGHGVTEVYVNRGDETLIEAWIYAGQTNYAGMIFGGEVWLRRIAFKDRAEWVPMIVTTPDGEVSHGEFRKWIEGEFLTRRINGS